MSNPTNFLRQVEQVQTLAQVLNTVVLKYLRKRHVRSLFSSVAQVTFHQIAFQADRQGLVPNDLFTSEAIDVLTVIAITIPFVDESDYAQTNQPVTEAWRYIIDVANMQTRAELDNAIVNMLGA